MDGGRRRMERDGPGPANGGDPQQRAERVVSLFTGEGTGQSAAEDGPAERRGRGPRGYVRPDARIYEDVCERLTEDPTIDASEIEVSVADREVTLKGVVNGWEARRLAEHLARGVPGVLGVTNELRVR